MRRKTVRGFTLIECMIAAAITAIAFLSTLSLLGFARLHNEIEQERSRAHQMVSEALEIERYQLFTWTQSSSQRTIWDNRTPDDTTDDTIGTLAIIVRDAATGTTLTMSPIPSVMVSIEATLTWNVRGRLEKELHETVMTYEVPRN